MPTINLRTLSQANFCGDGQAGFRSVESQGEVKPSDLLGVFGITEFLRGAVHMAVLAAKAPVLPAAAIMPAYVPVMEDFCAFLVAGSSATSDIESLPLRAKTLSAAAASAISLPVQQSKLLELLLVAGA